MKRFLILALAVAILSSTCDAIRTSQLKWYNMKDYPLYGTLVKEDSLAYTRLPDSLKGKVRDDLYDLGTNTAGMYIRFSSDASAIGAKWKAKKAFSMNHMTATGIRGLDLYTLVDGKWTTVGSARPGLTERNSTSMIITDMEPETREYMLYLPLYDGVDSIFIGVDSTATVDLPRINSPRADGHPIVMYGTSILQGGCASRTGMIHTSMVGRELDREVVNLGFSGNARLDPEIARIIAQSNAALVVIDALPNITEARLNEAMEPFVKIIRDAMPEVPIVLVESPVFPVMRFNTETLETITDKNAALAKVYDRLKKAGDCNLYYFKGSDVLGDCVEGTVDNYHFTDLGFTTYASRLVPFLKPLLKN